MHVFTLFSVKLPRLHQNRATQGKGKDDRKAMTGEMESESLLKRERESREFSSASLSEGSSSLDLWL